MLESKPASCLPVFYRNFLRIRITYESLKHIQNLTLGGSPLADDVGNKLKDFVHLFMCFGTTECGYYALEETDPEDWKYASFSPIMAYELRPFSEDLSDFFFVRNKETEHLRSQGAFETYPHLEE